MPTRATNYTYNNGTGDFSTGFTPTLGTAPTTTTADTFVFPGSSSNSPYVVADDLTTALNANALNFTNLSAAVTLTRGGMGTTNLINLGGTNPSVNVTFQSSYLPFVQIFVDLSLTVGTTTTFTSGGNGSLINLTGVISGGGGVTDSALFLMFGGANTYSGGTTISAGREFFLTTPAATAGTGAISNNGTLIFEADGQQVVNDISGSGALSLTSSNSTVTLTGALSYTGNTFTGNGGNTYIFASAKNSTLTGIIGTTAGGTTNDSVTQAGTGILTLSGANNYTGTTTVSAGTLLINGNTSAATGAVNVTGGSLGGTGTIGGAVTLSSGARLSAGTVGGVGTLTLNNTATFNAGSILQVDLAGGAADRLQITGALTIASGAQLVFTGLPDGISSYTLATFSSLTNGTASQFTGMTPLGYQINYTGTSITLTPVPEPTTWAAVLLAIGFVGSSRYCRS